VGIGRTNAGPRGRRGGTRHAGPATEKRIVPVILAKPRNRHTALKGRGCPYFCVDTWRDDESVQNVIVADISDPWGIREP